MTAQDLQLFSLTLRLATGELKPVQLVAPALESALALAADQLGPVTLHSWGARRLDGLTADGDRVVIGGGRLLPSPHNAALRPGAVS